MSADLQVTRSVEGGIARFTINRPEAGGAINYLMRDQLTEWFEEASADLSIRVIVLESEGTKGFCTGADLRSMPPAPSRPEVDQDEPAAKVGELDGLALEARHRDLGSMGSNLE